ncbi:MAG: CPBP family intramembrane metalloprotease [Clostridiales bacterium]|nr:CPBP family intramembrane metalloprotease [Clostridiales bacterium]
MNTIEKKKLWIFIAVAYGVTALMAIPMYIGFRGQADLTAFVNVQMMYPACGVILGKLITRKDEKLPMGAYRAILIMTAVMMVVAVLSVFIHIDPIDAGTGGKQDVWNIISQCCLLPGSVAAYVMFWTCGKERAANAGTRRKNIKLSIIMVAIYIGLIFARTFFMAFLGDRIGNTDESMSTLIKNITNPLVLLTIASLPANFAFSFAAFFGEEYGWRYYLQPIMQDKFGKRLGVLLLGLVWAVWHWDADFFFYSKESGLVMFASQFITCVTIAIFFGYAYMKTHNIWVPVILHYINNNLSILLTAGTDVNAIQNQEPQWGDLIFHLLGCLMFAVFIFAPVYNDKRKAAKAGIEESGN